MKITPIESHCSPLSIGGIPISTDSAPEPKEELNGFRSAPRPPGSILLYSFLYTLYSFVYSFLYILYRTFTDGVAVGRHY